MGRTPCCSKLGLNRGPWTAEEDGLLTNYIQQHGEGHWRHLPKSAGLLRCGKSCRLRWVNYLRPDIKRGNIAPDEEDLIVRLHKLLGNRWSLIAKRLPGRTDNEIKNYWNTHLSKRFKKTTTPSSSDHQQPSKDTKKTKKKKKKKQENAKNEEPEKIKVYLPKAIRVSPFLLTFKNNATTESASSNGSEFKEANDYNERSQTTTCVEEDDTTPTTTSTLEKEQQNNNIDDHLRQISSFDFSKLYEEYEELLKSDDQIKFDSFLVDSFLV